MYDGPNDKLKKLGGLEGLNTENALALADHLDTVSREDFDMDNWCNCIAGHAVKVKCKKDYIGTEPTELIKETARKWLGLNTVEAYRLFTPGCTEVWSPKEAAEHLRGMVKQALTHVE